MPDGIELAKAYVQIVPSAEGIQGKITEALGGEPAAAGDAAGQSLGAQLVGTLKKVIAAAGIGKIISESINLGGALQQSLGGVETLFKDSADTVKAYAAQAYKTVGLSANDYMEQTTSFAASLLSSVSQDTQAAADLANMAMVDMADNSNKMGTSMQDIQNAYQGFAKQNYTMLDNLKLGYGGTQAEMQRMLNDATKISGVKYDLGNLADMYSAIHIIQQEMDITGTTAKEAATTLTGSFAAMKAAAENVMGNWSTGADLTEPLQALADTAQTFLVDNLLPMIGNVLAGIPEIVYSLVPELLQTGTELLSSLAQGFTEGIPEFFSTALPQLLAFTDQLRDNAASFVDAGLNLITQLINGLIAGLPDLIAYVPDIIINICGIINDNMPRYCVERAMRLLSRKHRKALCGAKVLALGVAYKNDIDDCRESPAIRVLKLLREEGAEVTYFDPWVAQYKEDGQVYYSEKELTPELVQAADLVIVTAGHNNVDYAMVQKNAKAVFDTKNVMRKHNAFGDNVEVL